MLVSIYTPSHRPAHLLRAYESLKVQTHKDWEWVIYLNGEGVTKTPQDFLDATVLDSRVKVYNGPVTGSCGAAKAATVELCAGEFVVELDHDDELVETCIERIIEANADFFFSENANSYDEVPEGRYNPLYGWEYSTFNWRGKVLQVPNSPIIAPTNFSLIYFAPNHVRAYRKSYYDKIGGYNKDLPVCDDHDLMVRAYLGGGKIHHCKDVLYVYHFHKENTFVQRNEEVQQNTWRIYHENIWKLIEKWADDNNYPKIDLGAGKWGRKGYTTYDLEDANICGDLNDTWKLEDNSVAILRAHDIFEHLRDPIHAMNEAYRVLMPNGLLMLSVPSALGQGGFCDPTHVSYWVERSIRYYTEPSIQQYVKGINCKFMKMYCGTVNKWDDCVPYVDAHLMAWKPAEQHLHGVSYWR